MRSLSSLGITGETYGVILTPLIVSRLTSEIRMVCSHESKGEEMNLDYLLEFMRDELERRERADTFKISSERTKKEKREKQSLPTASSLMAPSTSSECSICQSGHNTWNCVELKGMSLPE